MSDTKAKIYVGQDLHLRVTLRDQSHSIVNISSATLAATLRCLGKSKVDLTPSLYTDGTDGMMYYNLDSTHLTRPGKYVFQGIATINSKDYPTTPVEFTVLNRS